MAKISSNKSLSAALFLIGLVMLIESASTIFVLVEAPSVAASSVGVAWAYVMIKGLVSLYVLFTGFRMLRTK
ncbi:MAG: seg [archaeon GW2011_AR5]|nr:MAG: seg [archaeon GW2011_AR5]MBS3051130.1 hypothetical protein [Candidatus Aenigmarchaeota archaeon]